MKKMSTRQMSMIATKVDRNDYFSASEEEQKQGGYYTQIAYNRNIYGQTARLYKGTATGKLVYTTDIYAVSM